MKTVTAMEKNIEIMVITVTSTRNGVTTDKATTHHNMINKGNSKNYEEGKKVNN